MNNVVPPDGKLLKCPSCGAPITSKAGQAVVKCEYCGSRTTVGSPQPPSAPTTIIIETRHRRVGPHRLRRLLESAEFASKETGNGDENPEVAGGRASD